MDILEWLFGPSSTVIDEDWIQSDLREMPLTTDEYCQIAQHDSEAVMKAGRTQDEKPIGKMVL